MSAYKRSLGGDLSEAVSRVFFADYDTCWQSILEALKSSPIDITNKEGGLIQTQWIENTTEKNMAESSAGSIIYQKAQFRLKIFVARGILKDRPSVKVSVVKEQVVQRDALEGYRPQESNQVEEQSFIYRIGQLIWMHTKMNEWEKAKIQHEIEKQGGNKSIDSDADKSKNTDADREESSQEPGVL